MPNKSLPHNHGENFDISFAEIPKEEDLKKLRSFIDTLDNVSRVEVLPYHNLGAYKWEKLGYDYPLKDTPLPTKEEISLANEILQTSSYH